MSGETHYVEMSEKEFLEEALNIVGKAQSQGICLRLMGALAVHSHSLDKPDYLNTLISLPRFDEQKPRFTDLDLMGYKKHRQQTMRLLEKLEFRPDHMLNAIFSGNRLLYYHPLDKYHIDVFLDKLEFSHSVFFAEKGAGRLELDYPTISLADMALEKLQIHLINRKDVVDLLTLLTLHDVQPHAGNDQIDGGYIASTLSNDWGFWFDATNNLEKVKEMASNLRQSDKLPAATTNVCIEQVEALRKLIDDTPKTKNWEKRGKVGTNKPWYREIDEVIR
jgi:hypothetical protein